MPKFTVIPKKCRNHHSTGKNPSCYFCHRRNLLRRFVREVSKEEILLLEIFGQPGMGGGGRFIPIKC